jgi:hypothetical protein
MPSVQDSIQAFILRNYLQSSKWFCQEPDTCFVLAKEYRDIFPVDCFKNVGLDHTWLKFFCSDSLRSHTNPEIKKEQKRFLNYVAKCGDWRNKVYDFCDNILTNHTSPIHNFRANFLDRAKYDGVGTWKQEIKN